jgi:hypothetical protein
MPVEKLPITHFRLRIIHFRLRIIDFRPSVIGFRLRIIGFGLRIIGFRLRIILFALTIIRFRLTITRFALPITRFGLPIIRFALTIIGSIPYPQCLINLSIIEHTPRNSFSQIGEIHFFPILLVLNLFACFDRIDHRDFMAQMRYSVALGGIFYCFIKAVVGRIIKLIERIQLKTIVEQTIQYLAYWVIPRHAFLIYRRIPIGISPCFRLYNSLCIEIRIIYTLKIIVKHPYYRMKLYKNKSSTRLQKSRNNNNPSIKVG